MTLDSLRIPRTRSTVMKKHSRRQPVRDPANHRPPLTDAQLAGITGGEDINPPTGPTGIHLLVKGG